VLDLEVLASGSRGNAAFLALGGSDRYLMIDAGLSPRRTRKALEAKGLPHHALTDVLLTHGDGDHLHAGWAKAAAAWSFTMHVHERHLDRARRAGLPNSRLATFDSAIDLGDVQVESVLASHDSHGTAAFVIRHERATLGWATDLGRVDAALLSFFRDASPQVMAIESNYDHDMQVQSDRPAFLIDRIMGGAGHLSNDEALEAVETLAETCEFQDVVLLHRSQQCNCPRRIETLWRMRSPVLADRVTIASQTEPVGPIRIGVTTPAAHPI